MEIERGFLCSVIWSYMFEGNEWFTSQSVEKWKYEEMPSINEDSMETIRQVKSIFPNAMVFKDTHRYDNNAFLDKIYCVGGCKLLSTSDLIMITGDYQTSRSEFLTKGKWASTIEEAWRNAWAQIQEKMLEKFAR
jgi:hypothetical protein